LLNAARNRSRELLAVNGNKFGLNPVLQMRLWHAHCRSVLEYGCPLWGPSLSADRAAELGLEWGTASAFVRGELGPRTLAARRDELTLRLFGELIDFGGDRLAARVIRARFDEVRDGQAVRSWCSHIVPLLQLYDLHDVLESGGTGTRSRKDWLDRVIGCTAM
jgi:hypothetical protein